MKNLKWGLISILLASGVTPMLDAQDSSPDFVEPSNPEEVLAYQGEAILSQKMMAGAFSEIPEEVRLMFIRDGVQVKQMMQSLLQTELVAIDAEMNGYAEDPIVKERMLLAARKELAEAWLEEIVKKAPPADYQAMAYENYLVHPENFTSEEMVDVTHILIGNKERTLSEAEEIAIDLREQLRLDPTVFDEMVEEYSEDPGKARNEGHYRDVSHGKMVKPFEDTAFSMQSEGEISEPVKTEFGYHLIRLDKKHEPGLLPFDKVKIKAEEEAKKKHLSAYRKAYLKNLWQHPIVIPEGSVEYMAKQYFGEDLQNAPIFHEDGIE